MKSEQYLDINRDAWNQRVGIHLASEFYDLDGFLQGNTSLNDIELALLGDLRGKSVLHLQCHFGQDTLSLARMGAEVTGVDLSDKGIETARQLAVQTNTAADFICCDVYTLPEHLHRQFDIVFTSYGVIGWLPDLGRWAEVIAACLKPGGKLVFVEFHPVVWMFDDHFQKIAYRYSRSEAIIDTENGTYADNDAPVALKYVMWNHGIAEILNSLIRQGLEIQSFDELDYSPYNCFRETVEFEPKKYRIKHLGDKIPMVMALVAEKTPGLK